MTTVMTHQDDGGDLSVFAGADQILFACNKGHYWILEAAVHEVKHREDSPAPDMEVESMVDNFGPDLIGALGM